MSKRFQDNFNCRVGNLYRKLFMEKVSQANHKFSVLDGNSMQITLRRCFERRRPKQTRLTSFKFGEIFIITLPNFRVISEFQTHFQSHFCSKPECRQNNKTPIWQNIFTQHYLGSNQVQDKTVKSLLQVGGPNTPLSQASVYSLYNNLQGTGQFGSLYENFFVE